MAETDNPDAPIVAPRASRFGEGPEGKAARRERGEVAPHQRPGRFIQFLHDVRAEMKRVSWPTLTHVQNTTIITVIAVIFFAVYLFLVDQALSRLINGLDWAIEKLARLLGLA
ncbi:MAG TPA: preprotein translocase subunit SecE [Pyrinomonadaceae bacterium]|jgi:preprotein translocase subunit SecE|nr:preprotein translocase subunit SecE [Pyrinomonadaceae bacterium]